MATVDEPAAIAVRSAARIRECLIRLTLLLLRIIGTFPFDSCDEFTGEHRLFFINMIDAFGVLADSPSDQPSQARSSPTSRQGSSGRRFALPSLWWAHLVGALRVHPHKR